MPAPRLPAEGREPRNSHRAAPADPRLRLPTHGCVCSAPIGPVLQRGCTPNPSLPSGWRPPAPYASAAARTPSRGRAGGHANPAPRSLSKRYLSSAGFSCSARPRAWKRSREGLRGRTGCWRGEPAMACSAPAARRRLQRGRLAASCINNHQPAAKRRKMRNDTAIALVI